MANEVAAGAELLLDAVVMAGHEAEVSAVAERLEEPLVGAVALDELLQERPPLLGLLTPALLLEDVRREVHLHPGLDVQPVQNLLVQLLHQEVGLHHLHLGLHYLLLQLLPGLGVTGLRVGGCPRFVTSDLFQTLLFLLGPLLRQVDHVHHLGQGSLVHLPVEHVAPEFEEGGHDCAH